MTRFRTIRQCFVKPDANDTFLILTFAAFQFFAANAWALPKVVDYAHFTDRRGPHSLPAAVVGDKVQISAFLDSTDPIGSPTISVQAIQGGTTLTLDPVPPIHPLFEGRYVYSKFIDFDPGLTGSWEFIPTDSTGTGPSSFSNAIVDPEFLPLVENVTVQGTSLGARVSWTLPNLDGFDVDGIFVRVIEATSGRHMWQTNLLSVQTTSFTPPSGVLQEGVDYVYWINLHDFEGSFSENSSKAFSQPFRYTALTRSGDFNLDGSIDAADYVVWRNGLGTTYSQNNYNVWRANFGASLGPGSGSVLPSADPLSATVPEPATLLLMISTALGWCLCQRRTA
ncbi:MAG TPA: PEP-CTERM sorting domain-containing protein [Lacipirellulaceae bacterium]|jgi:hypothetical protein|nr:PEP-CTERM sorting domain-containing protein [Lacipirellulaceae bacterium]